MGYYSEWNFEKLPKEEHVKVLRLVEELDADSLIIIHDTYELSNHSYCCARDGKESVMKWFRWAIGENIISDESE